MIVSSARAPVLVVAGARPNFMKVAPILRALAAAEWPAVLVHTGQHYDAAMSDAFFQDLGLPRPDFSLEVGSGTHALQTARIMQAFEPVLDRVRPSWVVVVGDVNSTVACALVVAKRRVDLRCRLAHVEAGLRSGDWRMPEEVNRVLTDRLADLLLTPSHDAHPHLVREGISPDATVFVGNVMIDTLHDVLPAARARGVAARLGLLAGTYAVATLHRPSNVDDPVQLQLLMDALARVAETTAVVFPVHPRTKRQIDALGQSSRFGDIKFTAPMGYVDMLGLMDSARAVITDSGGIQEETTVLGVPCLTVREHTERPATISHGSNALCAWPPSAASLDHDMSNVLQRKRVPVGSHVPDGWDGAAAQRIVGALASAPWPSWAKASQLEESTA